MGFVLAAGIGWDMAGWYVPTSPKSGPPSGTSGRLASKLHKFRFLMSGLYPQAIRQEENDMPQVNVRTSSERLAFIDRTASIRGVSRTEFVLRSSETAAIEALNERPVIALDDEAWDDFVTAIDSPVEPDPAVKARYMRRPQRDR